MSYSSRGLLEPFSLGLRRIVYKQAHWPIAIGIDVHRVRKRDYNMRFNLRDYRTTVGHVSVYYDAGGMFDIDKCRSLPRRGWGLPQPFPASLVAAWRLAATRRSPTFHLASLERDHLIRRSTGCPLDWIVSSPNRIKRRLMLRPITRDGGAQLSSARRLYREIEISEC